MEEIRLKIITTTTATATAMTTKNDNSKNHKQFLTRKECVTREKNVYSLIKCFDHNWKYQIIPLNVKRLWNWYRSMYTIPNKGILQNCCLDVIFNCSLFEQIVCLRNFHITSLASKCKWKRINKASINLHIREWEKYGSFFAYTARQLKKSQCIWYTLKWIMALWKLIVYLLGCLLETVNGSVASTERYNYNWPLRIFNSRALTLTTVTPFKSTNQWYQWCGCAACVWKFDILFVWCKGCTQSPISTLDTLKN